MPDEPTVTMPWRLFRSKCRHHYRRGNCQECYHERGGLPVRCRDDSRACPALKGEKEVKHED